MAGAKVGPGGGLVGPGGGEVGPDTTTTPLGQDSLRIGLSESPRVVISGLIMAGASDDFGPRLGEHAFRIQVGALDVGASGPVSIGLHEGATVADVTHIFKTGTDAVRAGLGDGAGFVESLALVARIAFRIDMEFSGYGNGWTDVTADVHEATAIDWSRGLDGAGSASRVASTGTLNFALKNDASNSGGRRGYYSPGHANQRPGFGRGIGTRLSLAVDGANQILQFVGELRLVRPEPDVHGDQLAICQAVDWLYHASRFRISDIPVQLGAADDAIFGLLVAGVPIQPRAIETHAGFDTYAYALDNSAAERSFALAELQRLAQSSLSRVYVQRDGTLTYETRDVRPKQHTAVVLAIQEADIPSGSDSLVLDDDSATVLTKVQVKIHPRRIDGAPGSEIVLYQSQQPPRAEPNLPLAVRGLFTKPGQDAFRVGGLDMLQPVAGVDYVANTAADGSGADVTAFVTVTALFSANSAAFTITSSYPSAVYLTTLQARGVGVYDQQDTVLEAQIAAPAGIAENVLALDMPYQTDAALALEEAQYELHLHNQQDRKATSVTVDLTKQQDPVRARAIAIREISDRITVTEEMTAMPVRPSEAYYVNSVTGHRAAGGKVTFEFGLELVDETSYWILEQPGASELDFTTIPAFGLIVGHTDVAHIDAAHVDSHGDSGHVDVAHADAGHGDGGHTDVAHADSAHSDAAHTDVAHVDSAHNDSAFQDVAHGDAAHVDSHSDVAHTDTHTDTHGDHDDAHGDVPLVQGHSDVHLDAHTDTAHADAHNDSAHSDAPHIDEAHEDFAHVDSAHNDVAHVDVLHGDSGHADSAHTDVAHSDAAHTDVAHSDVVHGDVVHGDVLHGDAN